MHRGFKISKFLSDAFNLDTFSEIIELRMFLIHITYENFPVLEFEGL